MKFLKVDDVLWERHLGHVPALLGWLRRATETEPVTLLVNGAATSQSENITALLNDREQVRPLDLLREKLLV